MQFSPIKGLKQTLLACFMVLAATFSQAQDNKPFEGMIQMDLKIDIPEEMAAMAEGMDAAKMGMPSKIQMYIKGNKSRQVIDLKNPGPIEIINAPDKSGKSVVYRLDRAKKTAYRTVEGATAKQDAGAKKPEIVKGTKTRDILGYKCVEYTMTMTEPTTGMDVKQVLWVTKDLNFKRPVMSKNDAWMNDIDGFPMRIEMDMMMVKVVTTVSKVERTPISDEQFEVPAGFKVQEETLGKKD